MHKNQTDTAFVVFGYNRAEHLEQCLSRLVSVSSISKDFPVYLFIDGPRTENDIEKVTATLEAGNKFSKLLNIEISTSPVNLGLAKSILSGVGTVLERHESIIVLEDDILISDAFIDFALGGLAFYKDEPKVASIHGYCADLSQPLDAPFFLRGADCWGWATWRDRWELIDLDAAKLLESIRDSGLEPEFNFGYSFPFSKLLEAQGGGSIKSWAILWHASMFNLGKLTLYPHRSLIENIGFEGSGTNFKSEKNAYNVQIPSEFRVGELPTDIIQNRIAYKLYRDFYLRTGGFRNRIYMLLRLVNDFFH